MILSICGNVSMAIAFLFVGPAPFIAIETKLSIIQGMAALVGFAYASIVVSSFGRSQRAAMNLGYADDINTYMAISGILIIVEFLEYATITVKYKWRVFEFSKNFYFCLIGMWSASFYFGNFVGPTTSGILVDAWGFKFTTVVPFVVYLFSVIVDFLELLYQTRNSFKDSQQEYLNVERDHQNEETNSLLINN